MRNAHFEPILQCVSRYTASRLVFNSNYRHVTTVSRFSHIKTELEHSKAVYINLRTSSLAYGKLIKNHAHDDEMYHRACVTRRRLRVRGGFYGC